MTYQDTYPGDAVSIDLDYAGEQHFNNRLRLLLAATRIYNDDLWDLIEEDPQLTVQERDQAHLIFGSDPVEVSEMRAGNTRYGNQGQGSTFWRRHPDGVLPDQH